ncbi:MAG TPA: hypothetical protein QF517_03335 [Pseudomonadales bacterium]|nr:hypothetical protein [Pseudomonadales bacterium]MDP6314700.1 hypothetical protein [Pseudomonadales bacterium]MDP7313263.1 hypothetical protein [Pseudomonadales bacterium]MDP7576391.1 hypothetical protein [Pseudomonadales bacterium]HJL60964.1 hypothetical protein [Pseudomonadales bacterium]
MSLTARALEDAGIATALVSVMEPLSSAARPPRQVIRRLNIGATVGRPKDLDGQRLTLARMISLIEEASEFGAITRDKKE